MSRKRTAKPPKRPHGRPRKAAPVALVEFMKRQRWRCAEKVNRHAARYRTRMRDLLAETEVMSDDNWRATLKAMDVDRRDGVSDGDW